MEPSQRPQFDEIHKSLADLVGKAVHEWSKGDRDLSDCCGDAFEILDCYYNEDGYELAKEFDRKHYSADSELVEVLNDVEMHVYRLLREATEVWVKDNKITLDIPEGSVVEFVDHTRKTLIGEVVKHYPETAQYGIWHEGLKKKKGTRNLVINRENVSLCE
jgi:hypothetical protein